MINVTTNALTSQDYLHLITSLATKPWEQLLPADRSLLASAAYELGRLRQSEPPAEPVTTAVWAVTADLGDEDHEFIGTTTGSAGLAAAKAMATAAYQGVLHDDGATLEPWAHVTDYQGRSTWTASDQEMTFKITVTVPATS